VSHEAGRLVLTGDTKRTSALRRVPEGLAVRVAEQCGLEGDVCAFALASGAAPLSAEAVTGRAMTIAPGDVFLGTPGYRESTRWVVGSVPEGGLVPGNEYWVLADCGAVGAFIGDSPREKGHLGRVTFLGVAQDAGGAGLNIRQFAVDVAPGGAGVAPGGEMDQGAPVFLVVGTSSEVGKTTAAVNVLRALRKSGRHRVVALKATGTSSLTELHSYQDFGAAPCFDCVDFGLPTTYPSGRPDIGAVFEAALDACLSAPADAVLVECGGDVLGANVPTFLTALGRRRPDAKVILVASDALAALGAKSVLGEMGLAVTLVTGPCTDTPTIQQRTQDLCGLPAMNLARGGADNLFPVAREGVE
jgi:CobQ/CobB/MinD/ParA nucleotide binding domain